MCLSPVLVCVSSFVAFWPVFLCAEELLPVFSFAEPLLETEPSSLGNLLWVAMETEAAISGQRVVRSRFTDRLAHPPALLVTWVNSRLASQKPLHRWCLKGNGNSGTPRRRHRAYLGIFWVQKSNSLTFWSKRQVWTRWSDLLRNYREYNSINSFK